MVIEFNKGECADDAIKQTGVSNNIARHQNCNIDNTDIQSYPDFIVDDNLKSVNNKLDNAEVLTVLSKMEELNKSNEADIHSIASKRSSSSHTGCSSSPSIHYTNKIEESFTRSNSLQPNIEDDENLDLWAVWGNLIKSWEIEWKRRPNCVKELARRGIPQHFRTIAWQLLAGAEVNQIHDLYADYIRQTSPYEKIILRDIPRTYPEFDFFKDGGKGQQALFNVIKAYSLHDREVGYCQGSAFIVGQLLMQMPEEETFAVFVRLMEHYGLRQLFKPSMTELGLCMFQLEVIVQEQIPDLYMHFNNMGFDTSMYASSWFLTIFLTTVSLDLANRIMDMFLVDGMDAIFRVAISILQQSRVDLLQLDMEGMLKYFQREVRERYENDHELLFTVASRVHLNSKRMKKLQKEYLSKRTREQEEAIELRRLRTENRLLRQRIDYLERESSALADRLVRGQVDLAQQADACLNITHELNILRDINSEAHRRLEDAYETIRELSSEKGSIKKDKMEKGIQIDDNSMIEHIHQLQQELIEAHTKKADLEGTVREFKSRINELEFANKRLKEFPPEGKVAEIQEELIRVKMREAESSLSLKEMRQKLAEMEQQWQRFMQLREINTSQISTSHAPQSVDSSQGNMPTSSTDDEQLRESTWQSPTHQTQSLQQQQPQTARARIAKLTASIIGAAATLGGNNENGQPPSADAFEGWTHRELEDNFIGLKIREADTLAELKEMRQKIMELETQNHVSTNQLKRQDEEIRRLREEKDASVQMGQELKEKLKDCESQLVVLQSGLEEKSVMQRLKYAEAVQTVAELKQQLAQLESKRAEKELQGHIQCNLHNDSLASSTRSVTSLDGIQSLSSEEMVAFISTIKARKASTESNYGETDDSTETEANEPDSSTEISSAICHNNDIHSPVSPIITNDMANNISLAVHTETTDSGLSLNEN